MPANNNEGKIGYLPMMDFAPSDILYMLKDLPDACCIFKVLTDPFGTVKDMLFLFANEKYAAMTGTKTAELIGSTFYKTVKNHDEDWIKFSYQAAILRQSSINRTYNSQLDKWFDFWAVPVYQKGFCAFIIHDATAEKRDSEIRARESNTNELVIECAKAVSTPDFGKGIKRALKIVGQALDADMVYVVRTDGAKVEKMYEWVSKTCSTDLPARKMFEEFEMARIFDSVLGEKTVFFRDDMAAVMDTQPELYSRYLAGQVSRYMVAALRDKNETLGYLIADNYSLEKQIETVRAMETIAMFVGTQLKNQLLKDELIFLGSHDALTGIGNRHALNQTISELSGQTSSVGICYTDINGLKLINDEKGHEAGDQVIIETGVMFGGIFKKKFCYRIGGDEFIAIIPDIDKDKFEELVVKVKSRNRAISLSVGHAWSKSSKGIKDLIKKADEAMYKEKAIFYEEHERRQVNKH